MKSPDVAGTTVGGSTTYTLFTLLNADTKSIHLLLPVSHLMSDRAENGILSR